MGCWITELVWQSTGEWNRMMWDHSFGAIVTGFKVYTHTVLVQTAFIHTQMETQRHHCNDCHLKNEIFVIAQTTRIFQIFFHLSKCAECACAAFTAHMDLLSRGPGPCSNQTSCLEVLLHDLLSRGPATCRNQTSCLEVLLHVETRPPV